MLRTSSPFLGAALFHFISVGPGSGEHQAQWIPPPLFSHRRGDQFGAYSTEIIRAGIQPYRRGIW
jgi:hypothetical protein